MNGHAAINKDKPLTKSNGSASLALTTGGEETNSTTYLGASVKVQQNGTMIFKKGAAPCNGESHVVEFEGKFSENDTNGYNLRH